MWQWAPHVSLRAPHVSRPLSPSSLPLSPPPSSAVAPPAPPCRPSRPPPLPTAAACLPSARSAPATAGVGGGGWQAAAAWSRVRPWRLLLEGTADEVVAGDKARHEEDQRGETHQVTRSAGSERAGGELATTGRRRPWRREMYSGEAGGEHDSTACARAARGHNEHSHAVGWWIRRPGIGSHR